MFIYRSNRTEELARALSEVVRQPKGSPLGSETIVVSSLGIERWLCQELARHLGIVANARFPFPRAFIEEVLQPFGDGEFSRDTLTWAIAALLPGLEERHSARAISPYLDRDRSDPSLIELSRELANVFDQYVVYRPDLVRAWERGEGRGFQPDVFRALVKRVRGTHLAARAERYLQSSLGPGGPDRVSIFGVSTLPPIYLRVLSKLSREREVHVFLLSPSRGGGGVHPLFRSLGTLGQDFESLLLAQAPHAKVRDLFVARHAKTMLGRLQAELLDGRTESKAQAPRTVVAQSDDSIEFHSCHGSLREVEVLRNRLLDAFDRDPTLEPHDVAVMAADIDHYAPLIDAVFAQPPGSPGFIPYRIADRAIRASNGVADTVLRAFDLSTSRLSASDVLDFLQLDPVRARFGIAPEQLSEVRRLVSDAGIRWGASAAHRAAVGQPGRPENTWQFGLSRLLLGRALPHSDESVETFQGLIPRNITPEEADLVGKLSECCRALFSWHEQSRAPRPPKEWGRAVSSLLDTFVAEEEGTVAAARSVRATAERLVRAAEDARFDAPIDRAAWLTLLGRALESERASRHFVAGGVTFCALLPMRSVPFRLIYLLGLNDAQFPRKDSAPGFDLIARQPKVGDRSSRAEDRQLFLEVLLSARERLILSFVGRTIHENSPIPPSVVVSELMDAIDAKFSTTPGAPEQLALAFQGPSQSAFTEHPLQPFSPRYFGSGDPRLVSYVPSDAEGALALSRGQVSTPCFQPSPLSAAREPEIRLEDLVRFFENPARGLLRGRLGIDLGDEPNVISDRDPIILEPLDAYTLGADLLRRELRGLAPRDKLAWSRAHALLPFGTLGEVALSDVFANVAALAGRAGPRISTPRRDPVEVDTDLGDARVLGALRDVREDAQVFVGYFKIRARTTVRAWVHHLALQTSGLSLPTVLIGRSADSGGRIEEHRFTPLAQGRARELLAELVNLYRLGLQAPLAFFPSTSRQFVESWHREETDVPPEQSRALAAARKRFLDPRSGFAEGDDAYVKRLFAGMDPFVLRSRPSEIAMPSFCEVALTVFRPLIEASEREIA